MQTRQPAVGFIFITLLLDVLGFGLLIPVAPALVKELSHSGDANAAHLASLLASTYALMQFLFSPSLGVLSDMFGRRPVLLTSVLGSGLDYIAMSFAGSMPVLFVTRAVNGLSGASMTAASAYIADVTPPEKRAAAFGMIGAAFGMGFVLGPLLGGVLGAKEIHIPWVELTWHGSIRYPFYVAGALTLLNWLYGYFVLPESLPKERRQPFRLAKVNPIATIPVVAKYPTVFGLAAAMFLANVAQFGLHVVWVLYMGHRFGWDTLHTGFSLFIVGVGAALAQGFLSRLLIPRLGERRSLLISLTMGAIAFTGYGLATQGWMIYAIVGVASLGGFGAPAAQSIITRSVSPTEQGTVQGAMTSLNCLAQIAGPLIGGSVFAAAISEGSRLPTGAPFLLGAVLTMIAMLVAWGTLTWLAPPAAARAQGAAA